MGIDFYVYAGPGMFFVILKDSLSQVAGSDGKRIMPMQDVAKREQKHRSGCCEFGLGPDVISG